jgi:hypothetical protein
MLTTTPFKHHTPSGLDYLCESVTTPEFRYYTTPGGRRYPSASSVTSLLTKDAINAWRNRIGAEEADKISSMAARRGTDLHLACELYLKNELTPFKMLKMLPTTKELLLQVKPTLLNNINSIYCIEQSLYSDDLKMAGKTDGAVIWNSIPTIIDFKTSKKKKLKEYIRNYCLQSTAYAIMFKERTGIEINQFVLIIAIEGEKTPQIVQEPIQPYIDELYQCSDTYWGIHGHNFKD